MIYFATSNEGKVREAREYLDGIAPVESVAYDYTEIQHDDLAEIAATGAREAWKALGGGQGVERAVADPAAGVEFGDDETDSARGDVPPRDGGGEPTDPVPDEGVLVGDSGLFVEALDGFPGPYSAYVERTLGIEAIPRLLTAEDSPRAYFRTVLAYADGRDLETFTGSVAGRIVEPRGDRGFGYDPIFEYNGLTMAEMTTAEKNAISHRGRALEKFAEWYDRRTDE